MNILVHPDPPPLHLPRPQIAISMTGQPLIIVHMRPEPDPCEQERIHEPHARQPQRQRRRTGKKQQEGYVVKIPMPDRSAIEQDVHIQFLEQLPGDYVEVGCIGAGYDDPGGVPACALIPDHAYYYCDGCGVDEVFE